MNAAIDEKRCNREVNKQHSHKFSIKTLLKVGSSYSRYTQVGRVLTKYFKPTVWHLVSFLRLHHFLDRVPETPSVLSAFLRLPSNRLIQDGWFPPSCWLLSMIIRALTRALLDQAKSPSGPALCMLQWPPKMLQRAQKSTRDLRPGALPAYGLLS